MDLLLRALVRTSRRVREVIPEISNRGPVLSVSMGVIPHYFWVLTN
jgi:hypothetical protein